MTLDELALVGDPRLANPKVTLRPYNRLLLAVG